MNEAIRLNIKALRIHYVQLFALNDDNYLF